MILQALLLFSLTLRATAQDEPLPDIAKPEGSAEAPTDLFGSLEDDENNSWEKAQKEVGLDEARRKRQANEQPVVQEEPLVIAQRSHDSNSRDSHDRDDRRHRPDRPDRPSCNTVRCTSGTECIIENGRPTCRPIRPQPSRSCRDITCPRDSRCRMERDRSCRDRRCPDLPVCVRESRPSCSNVQCPPGLRCRVVEERGCFGRDCREFATCVSPCEGIRCPFGSTCQWTGRDAICAPIVIDQCLNARCPAGFQCRMDNNQPRCFPVSSQCPPNQVFAQCASPCEPSCAHASPLICPARCDPPRCQCAPGFWRHGNGQCVQRDQCFLG